jgi:hypothetical protein
MMFADCRIAKGLYLMMDAHFHNILTLEPAMVVFALGSVLG